MAKYQNKYRIQSSRATWWNYGWAGAYFITICTKNRDHLFGKIEQGEKNKMNLSNCGVLADVFWHEIKNHAKNVDLGAFVVMPNHIHGILILSENLDLPVELESPSTPQLETPKKPQTESEKRYGNQGKNTVSSIVGSYKSAVTKNANRLGLECGWQERFHDHIIRNDAEYQRINDYIESNIENWKDDKFF
jgi:putative transposase